MNEKFNAFQYVGEYCLMRKCDEQEYSVIKVHGNDHGVIKYSNVRSLVSIGKKEITYTPINEARFIDESFAVVKPLI